MDGARPQRRHPYLEVKFLKIKIKNPRRGLRNFKMPSQGDDWDFIDYIRIFLISLNVIGVLSFVLFGILYSFGMLFVFINWLWIKLRKNKEISSEEILRPLNRTLADA